MHTLQASAERDDSADTRRYRAATVEEAVAAAVRDLGPGVEIVEASRIRRGGVGGFFTTDLGVEVLVTNGAPAVDRTEGPDAPAIAAPAPELAPGDRPAGGVTPLAAGRRAAFLALPDAGMGGATVAAAGDPLEALLAAADRDESVRGTSPTSSFARHLADAVDTVDDTVVAEAIATNLPAATGERRRRRGLRSPATASAATPVLDDGAAEPFSQAVEGDDVRVLPRGGAGRRRPRHADGPESASIIDVVAEALAERGEAIGTMREPLTTPRPARRPAPSATEPSPTAAVATDDGATDAPVERPAEIATPVVVPETPAEPTTVPVADAQPATEPATGPASKRAGKSTGKPTSKPAARKRATRARTTAAPTSSVEVAADAIGRLLERVAVVDAPAGSRIDGIETLQVVVTAGDGTKIEMSATLGSER